MTTSNTGWVGRQDYVTKLAKLLGDKHNDDRGIKIISISGPGGCGKSLLFNHVFYDDPQALELFRDQKYLKLTATGTEKFPSLANLFTREIVTSVSRKGNDGKPIQFTNLQKLKQNIQKMNQLAEEQVRGSLNTSSSELTPLFDVLVKLGIFGIEVATNKGVASAIEKYVEQKPAAIAEIINSIKKYARVFEKKGFFGFLENSQYPRIRSDLPGLIAESFVADINSILERKDENGNKNITNLLLVFDNFEKYVDVIDKFIFEKLIPEIRRSSYQWYTTIVIIGRDQLAFSSKYIKGEASKNFHALFNSATSEILLEAFTPEEADKFLIERGVESKEARKKICVETSMFPFLLNAVVSLSNGHMSAEAADAFYERTCYWLTSQQKQWIKALAFLDNINVDTIPFMLPGDNVEEVWNWFSREKSIRDPDSEAPVINKFVRAAVQAVVENYKPSLAKDYREKAESAMAKLQKLKK